MTLAFNTYNIFSLKTVPEVEISCETSMDSVSQPHNLARGSVEAHGLQRQ